MESHKLVRTLPVGKFYYKGSHSHPVRRTVLIIENKHNYFTGYELREGSTVRKLQKAPIKSYRKDKIATESQLGKAKHREPGPNVSTLKRLNLFNLLKTGI